jgi:hypothetical protein
VPWGLDLALGIELFAGQAVPSALCRGLPLGIGSAEWNRVCAESISLSAKPENPVVYESNFQDKSIYMIFTISKVMT